MEGIIADLYTDKVGDKPLAHVWLKDTKSDYFSHLIDERVPEGPRSDIENYMSANRIHQLDKVEVADFGTYLKFRRIAPLGYEEFLHHFSPVFPWDIEANNPHRIPNRKFDAVVAFGTGNVVFSGLDEKKLLTEACEHLFFENPAVMVGHNTDNFDKRYLFGDSNGPGRFKLAKIDPDLTLWGRHLEPIRTIPQLAEYSKKKAFHVPGRISLDIAHFGRWFIPSKDNTLDSISALYGGITAEEKPEKFYMYVAEGRLEPIADHCRSDLQSILNVYETLLPCYLDMAGLVYAPLSVASRVRPPTLDEMITDAILVDKQWKLWERPDYAKQELERKLLEKKICEEGMYENVESVDISHVYLKSLHHVSRGFNHPIGFAADLLLRKYSENAEWLDVQGYEKSRNALKTKLWMYSVLGRELLWIVHSSNSPYRSRKVAEAASKDITNSMSELKNSFNNQIVFLDDSKIIYRCEKGGRALVWDEKSIFYDGIMTVGRVAAPKNTSDVIKKVQRNFISEVLSDPADAERYAKEERANISQGRIPAVLLAITVTKRKHRKEAGRLTWPDRVIFNLEKMYDYKYDKNERISIVATNKGWVDLFKEKFVEPDYKFYAKQFDLVMEKMLRLASQAKLC